MSDPHILGECGHCFCFECAKHYVDSRKECPKCKMFAELKNMKKSSIYQNIINHMKKFCQNFEPSESQSIVQVSDQSSHEKPYFEAPEQVKVCIKEQQEECGKTDKKSKSTIWKLLQTGIIDTKSKVSYLGQQAYITSSGCLEDCIERVEFEDLTQWANFIEETVKGKKGSKKLVGWNCVMLKGKPMNFYRDLLKNNSSPITNNFSSPEKNDCRFAFVLTGLNENQKVFHNLQI